MPGPLRAIGPGDTYQLSDEDLTIPLFSMCPTPPRGMGLRLHPPGVSHTEMNEGNEIGPPAVEPARFFFLKSG